MTIAFTQNGGTTEPVLAIHGISSQRHLWDWLVAIAPELSLIMPDLRGRGDSIDVAGPSSIAVHADDMVAVLDSLGLDAVHVCGMSMGGFVAVELAVAHPQRVKSLVLVDGGLPMDASPGIPIEMKIAALDDRLRRLDQRFASVQEYVNFFVANTAPLLDAHDPILNEYCAHDLRDGAVRLSREALLSDARDVFGDDPVWRDVSVPTRLLHAEWSVGAGAPPAYAAASVARYASELATMVRTRLVEGVDHAGIIMTKTGAAAVADVLREALA
jgi:pimeloyl-ACP methyl ester carboxylesterase